MGESGKITLRITGSDDSTVLPAPGQESHSSSKSASGITPVSTAIRISSGLTAQAAQYVGSVITPPTATVARHLHGILSTSAIARWEKKHQSRGGSAEL